MVKTQGLKTVLHLLNHDGVVKTLYLLRHFKFAVGTTYFSTPHSIKFEFLEYEDFYPKHTGHKYLAIQILSFYELINHDGLVKS